MKLASPLASVLLLSFTASALENPFESVNSRLPPSCQLDQADLPFIEDMQGFIDDAISSLEGKVGDFQDALVDAQGALFQRIGDLEILDTTEFQGPISDIRSKTFVGGWTVFDEITSFNQPSEFNPLGSEIKGYEDALKNQQIPAGTATAIKDVITTWTQGSRVAFRAFRGLRSCFLALTPEGLDIRPDPLNRTSCAAGHNITKVDDTSTRDTIDLEMTIKAINLGKSQLVVFKDIVGKVCNLFPQVEASISLGVSGDAGGSVGVEATGGISAEIGLGHSAEAFCNDLIFQPLDLAMTFILNGIELLLSLLDYFAYVDNTYNALLAENIRQATYENVLLLLENGDCLKEKKYGQCYPKGKGKSKSKKTGSRRELN